MTVRGAATLALLLLLSAAAAGQARSRPSMPVRLVLRADSGRYTISQQLDARGGGDHAQGRIRLTLTNVDPNRPRVVELRLSGGELTVEMPPKSIVALELR